MKNISLLSIILFFTSCENVKITDFRGFNGFVQILVEDLSTPIHSKEKPITFKIKQKLSFQNIVNNNKSTTFNKNEIVNFNIGLNIIDTTGKKLEEGVDFKVLQSEPYFIDVTVTPLWNINNNSFESSFQIIFLKKGIFAVYSPHSNLTLDRRSLLFSDKRLTVDFVVQSRQINLAKKYFSQTFQYLDAISDESDGTKITGYNGLFVVQIE